MSHCERRYCNQCGVSWEDTRQMPVVLFEDTNNYRTMEEAEKAAEMYGWTPENKMKPGRNVVGIQYAYNHPQHYDGISEWQCGICDARIGRWSEKILGDDEYEQRFGGE